MGEAQRHLKVKVKVVPAQPAFPACWADRSKGGQQSETGGDGHRRQTESNRPREKHIVETAKCVTASQRANVITSLRFPQSHMAFHMPTNRADNLQIRVRRAHLHVQPLTTYQQPDAQPYFLQQEGCEEGISTHLLLPHGKGLRLGVVSTVFS